MTTPALAQDVKGKGRHYQHPETGVLLPSVTNIIGVLDKPAIPRWAARTVAESAWKMRSSLTEMGEAECIEVLKGSPWRNSGRASDRGTSVHDYLDAAAQGRDVELEGEALTFKAGADDWLERYNPEFHLTEFTVFGDGYAGTADFMAFLNEGRLYVGDYKTGKGLYPEVALQLAAIRYATHIYSEGALIPMLDLDGAVAVLITPTKAKVCEVAADEAAHRAFLACRDAWHWKNGRNPIGAELEVAS